MSVRSSMSKLLAALPAVIIWTTMNVFITSSLAFLVLVELSAAGHRFMGLGAAFLTVAVVYGWLLYNHKFRAYIKSLEKSEQ